MPIYEYKCKRCGHCFEAMQKFSDNPLILCPKCGENGLQKCVSMPSFHLKGDGWYETDFKGKKQSKKSEDSSNKTSSAEKSTEKRSTDSGAKTDKVKNSGDKKQ